MKRVVLSVTASHSVFLRLLLALCQAKVEKINKRNLFIGTYTSTHPIHMASPHGLELFKIL